MSCTASDGPKPPIRPGLMLMMRHAPSSSASSGDLRARDRLVEADRRPQATPAAARAARDHRSRAAARSSSDRTRRARRAWSHRRPCRPRSRRPSAGCRRTLARIASTGSTVPARLDLDLDAPVARRPVRRRRARRARRWMAGCRSTRRPRWVAACAPSTSQSGRPASRACRSHDGHLQRGLGHPVSAHARPRAGDLTRMAERSAEHRTARGTLDQHVPGRRRGLRAVERIDVGDALAPAGHAVGVHGDEHELARVDPAEARLERPDQRQPHDRTARRLRCACPAIVSQASRPILSARVDFRYLAIEGPIGLGKTALAERLGARLDATVVLDERENPFLADFYAGRDGAAFQAQLFFTLARHRQQLRAAPGRPVQPDDDLRLPLRARSHLRVPEPRRQRAVHLSAALRAGRARLPPPDLVIYLQAPTDAAQAAACASARERSDDRRRRCRATTICRELNEAYNHFFFHYTATPLLVVETSQFDLSLGRRRVDGLAAGRSRTMGTRARRYYVPRTGWRSAALAHRQRSMTNPGRVCTSSWRGSRRPESPSSRPDKASRVPEGPVGQVSVVQPGRSTTRNWPPASRCARSARTTSG